MSIQLFFKILQINTPRLWSTHILSQREADHFLYDPQKINRGSSEKMMGFATSR